MNNLPPLPLIGGSLFIDNSGFMEGVSTCTRYLQYKTLNLRIPAGEKASLNFGSAAHLGKELRYCRYQNKPVDEKFYDDFGVLLTEFYNEHPVPSDDWRGLNFAMEMERKYNNRWEQEEFNLLRYETPIACPHCNGMGMRIPDGGLSDVVYPPCLWCQGTGKREVMVELPFSLPLYTHENIPVIYTGRIDLPLCLDSQIFVMDHKTSSQMGKQFWDEMRRTGQMRGYVWAFEQLTGMSVSGYIVNGIRTKELPKYVQEGKTHKRGEKSYDASSFWGETFQRDRFYVDKREIDYWKNNTIDLVEEFFWHYSRGYMPEKTKWCAIYGQCPYYEVCQIQPPEERVLFLQSGLFTDNVWSPLNKKNPTQTKQ